MIGAHFAKHVKLAFAATLFIALQTAPPVPPQAIKDHVEKAGTKTQIRKNGQQSTAAPAPNVAINASAKEDSTAKSAGSNTRDAETRAQKHESWSRGDILSLVYDILTGLLVIVGGIGVCFALRTLRAIERQSSEMTRQRIVMGEQLKAMEGQLAQMESSGRQTDLLIAQVAIQAQNTGEVAEAAQKSAKAAKENINLLIAKERARLKIAVRPLVFPSVPSERFTVDYEIHHYGVANAIIVESTAKAVLTDSEDRPKDTDDLVGGPPPGQIVRPDGPWRGRQPIFKEFRDPTRYEDPTTEDIAAVRNGPKVVHFWGFWIYDNGLGKRCLTNFRFRWKYDPLFQGGWHKYGEPDENQET